MVEAKTIDLTHLIKRCPECGEQYSPDSLFCGFDGQTLASARWTPAADKLLGTTIDGRYEVVAVLGEGGMGTVYKVRHVRLERFFAMKVLRQNLAEDEKLCARFIQEAKATASVRHPHVVAISDFGRVPDARPYFVMELLEGLTLSQVIRAEAPLSPVRAARIVARIARALGAAHEAGIVHRDLKPENIFLVGGNDEDVRVVDFGAALVVGGQRLTKTGVVFGTPHFMSPEQASGQPVDHRADVYALGVILYELCTGRVPFEADTFMGVLTKHVFAAPTPPSKLLVGRTRLGALEQVILRALEKQPSRRYVTMEAYATDLERILRPRGDGEWELARSLSDAPAAPPRQPSEIPGASRAPRASGAFASSARSQRHSAGTSTLARLVLGSRMRYWPAAAATGVGLVTLVVLAAVALRGGKGSAAEAPPSAPLTATTATATATTTPTAPGATAISATSSAAPSSEPTPPAFAASAATASAAAPPALGGPGPSTAPSAAPPSASTAPRMTPHPTSRTPARPAPTRRLPSESFGDPWETPTGAK